MSHKGDRPMDHWRRLNLMLMALPILASIWACRPVNPDTRASATNGVISTVLKEVKVPPLRSAEILSNLRGSLVTRSAMLVPTAPTAQRRTWLQAALLEEITNVNGIPRNQLEPLLSNVVTGHACGGANCAHVLALEPNQIDDFFNETLSLVANDPRLATKEHWDTRAILLGSLMAEAEVRQKKLKDLGKILSDLPKAPPLNQSRPKSTPGAEVFFNSLTKPELAALRDYTADGYKALRLVQTRSLEELYALGYPKETIRTLWLHRGFIDDILKKLPTAPGIVYRGVHDLTPEQVADLFIFHEQRSFVGLGESNLPATSSASWNPFIAWTYSASRQSSNEAYGVIFAIKQRSGVAVDSISLHPYEDEVMLPSQTQFQITEIATVPHADRVLYVELVEVLRH